jgi:hypothetical protein
MFEDTSCKLDDADNGPAEAQLQLREDKDGSEERRNAVRHVPDLRKPSKARHGGSGPGLHQSTFFFFFLSPKSGSRTMACKRLYNV